MIAPNGNVIVFNGEIYNYRELQQRFFGDVQFRSSGDTEVLMKLYEKFGQQCVEYLNGMFAFAVWDARQRRALIVRDRRGEKPLYVHERPGTVTFASELRALVRSGAPSGALSGPIVVSNTLAASTNKGPFYVAPTIASFAPASVSVTP